jgi:hypothetical protein
MTQATYLAPSILLPSLDRGRDHHNPMMWLEPKKCADDPPVNIWGSISAYMYGGGQLGGRMELYIYAKPGCYATRSRVPPRARIGPGRVRFGWAGGQEQTVDAALLVEQRASAQGVRVEHWEFEGVVHTFFCVWRGAPQSRMVFE